MDNVEAFGEELEVRADNFVSRYELLQTLVSKQFHLEF